MIKTTDRKLVVGLEIGTSKVSALVGEILPDGMVNIIGVGNCPCRGMDKGGVNDLESVVKCMQRAIDQAELMADCAKYHRFIWCFLARTLVAKMK
ncbi:Cell division protein FtsA [Arsenophonus endosymbiont of Bemisia tabaci Q2]|nr:Cell division protein FtsA [Arsenophonus endosymbiont of Bemisia tabaci Q2]